MQSYDPDLIDNKKIGCTCVGLTGYEMKLFLKKDETDWFIFEIGGFRMIKLEHVVLASPEQMEFIIEGMRNPLNSWDKSDTNIDPDLYSLSNIDIGPNDLNLMQRLAKAGTDHRKFMRMMPVYVRITAPLYW